jgi:hypothetical protein
MPFEPGAVNMTTEDQGQNPYTVVLADLRAKRAEIETAIQLLERLSGLASVGASDGVGATMPEEMGGIEETAGMFLGMSIVDATKKLLGMRKRTMGNPEIYRALKEGGLVLTGKEPVNVVGSVLSRRFNEVGDVVKVGRGIWGLKEWYPGRNFKAAGKALAQPANETDADGAAGATSTTPNVDDLLG